MAEVKKLDFGGTDHILDVPPWMSRDPETSRIWFASVLPPLCGAEISWSDDDGRTWGAGTFEDFCNILKLTQSFEVLHVLGGSVEPQDVPVEVRHLQTTRAMLTRFEEISNKLSEPLDADVMEKLLNEMGTLQEKIDACNAWELDRQLEIAMDAMRLPPPDFPAKTLSGGGTVKYSYSNTPGKYSDYPTNSQPNHQLNSDPYDLAYVDPVSQSAPAACCIARSIRGTPAPPASSTARRRRRSLAATQTRPVDPPRSS